MVTAKAKTNWKYYKTNKPSSNEYP